MRCGRDGKMDVIPFERGRKCGNAYDHDLDEVKKTEREYLDGVLNQIRKENDVRLNYPEKRKTSSIVTREGIYARSSP